MSELLMPPYPNGSVQQQLTQQYSYLFQMAQQLNMALSALEGGAVSTAGNSGQQRKSGGAAAPPREGGRLRKRIDVINISANSKYESDHSPLFIFHYTVKKAALQAKTCLLCAFRFLSA